MRTYETFDLNNFKSRLKSQTESHFIYYCPFCLSKRGKDDSNGKFYLSKSKLVGLCFKCDTVGFVESDDSKSQLDMELSANISTNLSKLKFEEDYEIPIPIKFDFSDVDKLVMGYLFTRNKYIPYLSTYLNIKTWKSNSDVGVVFPFYYNDEIVRFQVRFINPKNSDKRYYTYPGSTIPYSPNRVWKRFSKSVHSITLCEGVFDAIALLIMGYPNPIAILGNNLTDYHIFLLRRLVPQKIILALDTGDLNYKIKKSLIKIPSVSESEEVLFNSKDPDEYLKNSSDNYSSNVINLMRS